MKQTIEVEVGPEDDTGTCLVVLGGTRRERWERWDRNRVLDLGLTIPEPEPEPPLPPERTEYPLQRITESQFNGRISIHDFDEVLVAAHSLRVGDRVEWAPGDWREIDRVDAHREDDRPAITLWFDDRPFTLNRWELLAVRR